MTSKGRDQQILTDLLSMYKRLHANPAGISVTAEKNLFEIGNYERELSELVVREYSETLLPEDQVPERQHQYVAYLREMVPFVHRDDAGNRNFNTLCAGGAGLAAGAFLGAITGGIAAGWSLWILYASAIGSVGVGAVGAKGMYELLSVEEKKIFNHHLRALQRIDARQLDDTVYVSQALFDAALALESDDPKLIADARETIEDALRIYYPQLNQRKALLAPDNVEDDVPQLAYEER
tara:strand:- start:298 stop:1008 length:711 start_codon:yes stop_codon:yes gene_type:complete